MCKIIAIANVIYVTRMENDGKVIFGSTVTVKDIENEKKKSFKIVGKDEADIGKSLIYFKSPMGKSLIGKTIKDLVTVNVLLKTFFENSFIVAWLIMFLSEISYLF